MNNKKEIRSWNIKRFISLHAVLYYKLIYFNVCLIANDYFDSWFALTTLMTKIQVITFDH